MKMSKSATKNLFIGFVLVIVVLLGYYAFYTKTTPANNGTTSVEVSLDDHIRGAPNASVTLLEFGDFQCPACGSYEPLVRQMSAKYPNDLRVVFRHFPLTQIHPNALIAAKYAEAAGIQGKFWEMHDALYDNQKEWSGTLNARDLFAKYAGTIGLDVTKLATDAQSQSIEDKILAQYKEGTSLGVQGTPTFFLNGEKVDNPSSVEAFSQLIETAKSKVSK